MNPCHESWTDDEGVHNATNSAGTTGDSRARFTLATPEYDRDPFLNSLHQHQLIMAFICQKCKQPLQVKPILSWCCRAHSY